MHRTRAALAALIFATGCADGKVKADVDFGKVKSASWVERKLLSDSGDEHRHDFLLVSVSGWCNKANKIYPQLGAGWADVLATIVDNPDDVQAQCAAKKAFYEDAAVATEDVFRDGLQAMHIALRDPNETVDVPPFEGPYPAVGFDQVDRYVAATIEVYQTNPYRLYADEADCENKATFWESDAFDKLSDVYDQYTLSEGSGEVTKPSKDRYKVTVEGSLVDQSTKPAGDVTAKGSFELCDLTWQGDFPEFF